jgi:hypothetical protein
MSARAGIGSLLLATHKGDDWAYVGSAGTGFNERSAEYLRKTLDRIKRKTPPIKYAGSARTSYGFSRRKVAEIEYRAWTHDEKLRQASTRGCVRRTTTRRSIRLSEEAGSHSLGTEVIPASQSVFRRLACGAATVLPFRQCHGGMGFWVFHRPTFFDLAHFSKLFNLAVGLLVNDRRTCASPMRDQE